MHLSDEQIRTMSLEEKDRWWLDRVYKGDMPQLTIRAAATGMGLGLILSLTNLYIGIMTGWTLGVGVTSVILSFSLFKVLSRIGLGSEITMLENNAMQSVATSAGYMTAPLVSSVSAYMVVTGRVIPMHQTMAWIVVLAILGVLVAFPLKRRFINDEQLPFPEGRAAGIVMVAAGGLMGIKTGLSLLVGAMINYLILAPILIKAGIIHGTGFKNITMWALWGGVAMMTSASLYAFLSNPPLILRSFRHILPSAVKQEDVLAGIELPLWVFVVL